MRKIIFFLLGIFGIFVLLGSGLVFLKMSFQIFNQTLVHYCWFWLGFGLYFLVFLLLRRPPVLYIFGHELAHAVTGLFFGASLKKFRVTKNGGQVHLDKKNLFITLSPYFLPVYTILVLVIFKIGCHFRPQIFSRYGNVFLFLLGLTLSFHFFYTVMLIFSRQSDWNYAGHFFSAVFVGLANIFVIMLLMKILFPRIVPLRKFCQESVKETQQGIKFAVEKGQKLWKLLSAK